MADDLETWYAALVAPSYEVCSNDDLWLTLTFFIAQTRFLSPYKILR